MASLLLSLLLAAAADPAWVAVGAGDCQDAELITQVRALTAALAARSPDAVLDETKLAQRWGPAPSFSPDELRRQLEASRERFFHGEHRKVEEQLRATLLEARRLPPGAARWGLTVEGELLAGLAALRLGKVTASNQAFAAVLRVEPDHALDASQFAPATREAFEAVRRSLAHTRKVSVHVTTEPPGTEVFIEGRPAGTSPLTLELVPGTYELAAAWGARRSLPRTVVLEEETTAQFDLAFEGLLGPDRKPCLHTGDGELERLGGAVRVGALLGVERVVVVYLARPLAGASWLGASVVEVRTGEKTREGGVARGADDELALSQLAEFVLTGQRRALVGPCPPVPPRTPGVEASRGPSFKLPARVALGTAGVCLLAAGLVRLQLAPDLSRLEKQLDPSGAIPPDAIELAASVQGRLGWVNGLLLGAAAAAALGVTLQLLPAPKDAPASALQMQVSASGVFVHGRF